MACLLYTSIAGLLRYSGNIQIQEFPAKQMEAKRIFAYVPEMPSLFEALTVREDVYKRQVGTCLYFDQGGYGMQIGAHFFH